MYKAGMCETSLGRSQTWWPSMVLEFPKLDRLWTYKMTIYSPFWWHQWCDWSSKPPILIVLNPKVLTTLHPYHCKTIFWSLAFSNVDASSAPERKEKLGTWNVSMCNMQIQKCQEGWSPIKGVLHFNKHLQEKHVNKKTRSELPWMLGHQLKP